MPLRVVCDFVWARGPVCGRGGSVCGRGGPFVWARGTRVWAVLPTCVQRKGDGRCPTTEGPTTGRTRVRKDRPHSVHGQSRNLHRRVWYPWRVWFTGSGGCPGVLRRAGTGAPRAVGIDVDPRHVRLMRLRGPFRCRCPGRAGGPRRTIGPPGDRLALVLRGGLEVRPRTGGGWLGYHKLRSWSDPEVSLSPVP